jgi:DNA invertase Pin-like site-specific DNA recombinase
MDIGYARVSSQDQDTDLQLRALRAAGVVLIYSENTGGVSKRPELQRAILHAKTNDILVVWKLDRLARSLRDLLNIIDRLEAKGARFKSLTEAVDTSTAAGRMMVQMLGAVAEFERSLIRERSIAGQQAARERGHLPGRPKTVDAFLEAELATLYLSGWYTYAILADMFSLHPASVKRAVYRTTKPRHSSLD